MADEVLLPFPETIRPVTHIRSTLLLGALDAIRACGYADAYYAALSPETREAVTSVVAGMWLPVEVAHGHYRACDTLGISTESALQIGRGTFSNTKGLLLGAALGLAKGVGVTPRTLAPHFQRFWLRGYDGAGLRVIGRGPKEFQVDVVECSLLRSRYYRTALRGVMTAVVELVSTKAYLNERRQATESSMEVRVQWA